jgi:hypothetical protein
MATDSDHLILFQEMRPPTVTFAGRSPIRRSNTKFRPGRNSML